MADSRSTWRAPQRAAVALAVLGVVAVALSAVAFGAHLARGVPTQEVGGTTPAAPPAAPSCVATTTAGRLHMDPAQAAGASTIAAVGEELGLGDRAVTVALVAALQESKLRNLPSGDLDSVGLFQQRPSQGWGTPAQLSDPAYAARAFYAALVKVPGWEALAPGDVAQRVQRSAGPDAYHVWEHQARMLAEAFTGQAGAAVTCRFEAPATPAVAPVPPTAPFEATVAAELGEPALGVELPAARGWTVASWLVGHAYQYGITAVSFEGRTWDAATGAWRDQPNASAVVHVVREATR